MSQPVFIPSLIPIYPQGFGFHLWAISQIYHALFVSTAITGTQTIPATSQLISLLLYCLSPNHSLYLTEVKTGLHHPLTPLPAWSLWIYAKSLCWFIRSYKTMLLPMSLISSVTLRDTSHFNYSSLHLVPQHSTLKLFHTFRFVHDVSFAYFFLYLIEYRLLEGRTLFTLLCVPWSW